MARRTKERSAGARFWRKMPRLRSSTALHRDTGRQIGDSAWCSDTARQCSRPQRSARHSLPRGLDSSGGPCRRRGGPRAAGFCLDRPCPAHPCTRSHHQPPSAQTQEVAPAVDGEVPARQASASSSHGDLLRHAHSHQPASAQTHGTALISVAQRAVHEDASEPCLPQTAPRAS